MGATKGGKKIPIRWFHANELKEPQVTAEGHPKPFRIVGRTGFFVFPRGAKEPIPGMLYVYPGRAVQESEVTTEESAPSASPSASGSKGKGKGKKSTTTEGKKSTTTEEKLREQDQDEVNYQ